MSMVPGTLDKGAAKETERRSIAERALGGDILFSRGLGILSGQGGDQGPPVSSVWGSLGKTGPGGTCGPLPIPCWTVGLGIGVFVVMLLLIK